jgi:hypothetical protein
MSSLFNWFIALFAGFWLFLAFRGMAREFTQPGPLLISATVERGSLYLLDRLTYNLWVS